MTAASPLINYRNIRYRLLPGSKAKARQLFGLAGACRFIWNHFLATHQQAYRLHKEHPDAHPKPAISFFSLAREFTQLRNSDEVPWLRGYAFAVARAPLRHLSLAFKDFFQGKGHPRFKARGRDKPRFTIPDGVRIKGDHLRIPGVGLVTLRRHGGNPYPEGSRSKWR